ncbi:hypothetical protein RJ639_007435 [Escallonia herrerae]|uniref:Integrase n=1 Tax=Escallonia herrerae TaxID=1293975 RepID=A0AA88VZK9_9ASTE|nr:hypothetical protein RJ639_007435 [Escallonia herrerae]
MTDVGVVEDNYDGVDVLSVTISSSDGGWILDTGCSYDTCPNKDWFATYRSFDGGKVLMGKDVACKGSTVTGAAATASSSDIDSDTTKLWNTRLGHISERGMDVLSKQGLLGSKKNGKLDLYEHCVFGKQCRVKFSRVVHTTKERMKRTLLERARCMLLNARLSKEFWAEAVNTAAYLVNRSPSTAIDCKTLEEVWFGKHADYENLRIGCCPAYADVNDGKLEPRAKKCIFLGYANAVNGYRWWCLDSESSRFLISRDVTFDESSMLSKKRELIDAGKDYGVREKVELEVRAPDSLPIIPTDKKDGSHSTEENEKPQEQQYNIARTD